MDEIAAILAIVAAICFALAATLWQRASLELGLEGGASLLRLLGSGVWLLGLGAQTLGVLLQAAALDRGRVAIIQPLLVTSVIWALPLGYFLTAQVVTRRHILGAAIVVGGLAVFASVGDPAAGVDNAPTSDWVSALLVIARHLRRAAALRRARRARNEGGGAGGDRRNPLRRLGDAR